MRNRDDGPPASIDRARALADVNRRVVACTRCPRLVAWREQAALERPARYAHETYWARPLPAWGDAAARVLLVGLAPAAHGGNRTGRIFTGDRSGDFLFAALHAAGFANQPTSTRPGDGTELRDIYIAAVNRCCPPANRPTPEERDACLPYLVEEMRLLAAVRVVVALGAFAWDGVLRASAALGIRAVPTPRFGHAVEATLGPWTLVGSFHPSQQNTFTRKLTPVMLETVLLRARLLAGLPDTRAGAAVGRRGGE